MLIRRVREHTSASGWNNKASCNAECRSKGPPPYVQSQPRSQSQSHTTSLYLITCIAPKGNKLAVDHLPASRDAPHAVTMTCSRAAPMMWCTDPDVMAVEQQQGRGGKGVLIVVCAALLAAYVSVERTVIMERGRVIAAKTRCKHWFRAGGWYV